MGTRRRIPRLVEALVEGLHHRVAGREGGVRVVPGQEQVLAEHLVPAHVEELLQIRDPGSGHPDSRVAPRREPLPSVDVLLADVEPAAVPDLRVDDGDLAVVPVVHPGELGDVGPDLRPRLAQLVELDLRVLQAADEVVQDPHLDPRRDAIQEDPGDARGELVLSPDEVVHVDEPLRRGQVGEQHVEVLLPGAVEVAGSHRQDGHAQLPLGHERDARVLAREPGHELPGPLRMGRVHRRHEANEDVLQAPGGRGPLDVARPVASEEEVDDEPQERDREEDEQPGERGGGLPVLGDDQDGHANPVDDDGEVDERPDVDRQVHSPTISSPAVRVAFRERATIFSPNPRR